MRHTFSLLISSDASRPGTISSWFIAWHRTKLPHFEHHASHCPYLAPYRNVWFAHFWTLSFATLFACLQFLLSYVLHDPDLCTEENWSSTKYTSSDETFLQTRFSSKDWNPGLVPTFPQFKECSLFTYTVWGRQGAFSTKAAEEAFSASMQWRVFPMFQIKRMISDWNLDVRDRLPFSFQFMDYLPLLFIQCRHEHFWRVPYFFFHLWCRNRH